jgi:DNA ligase-1
MIFDAPLVKGTFRKRLAVLEKKLAEKPNEVVRMLKQTVCNDKDHLGILMDKILGFKGEGVMLKDPESLYEGRRSLSLLKVKKFEDAEAVVIAHNKGTGRCANMCGAIQVREKDGTEFKIGSGFDDA